MTADHPLTAKDDDIEEKMGKNEDEKMSEEVTDVRALLAQKEKDLILAAELGKALLEKNEDLSQQNEKMAEEFSKQLEVSTFFLITTEIRMVFESDLFYGY